MVFPGTPAYRSPESWLFELRFYREPAARYVAGPADDLYSLGVTACCLLTGEYPEPGEPTQDEHGTWHLEAMLLPPALLSDPRVEPRLRALVLRLLSVRPEERGTATALAEALEQAAEHPAPQSTPLEMQEPPPEQSSLARGCAGRLRPRAPTGPGWPSLALAAASLALAVWTWWAVPRKPLEESSVAQAAASRVEAPDAGTAGLGAAAATPSLEEAPSPPIQEGVTESTLPEPLPGQLRPDEKGRCHSKGLVVLNGGCWAEFAWDLEKCTELGGQMFKGTCYMPFLTRGRRPNSSSMDKR